MKNASLLTIDRLCSTRKSCPSFPSVSRAVILDRSARVFERRRPCVICSVGAFVHQATGAICRVRVFGSPCLNPPFPRLPGSDVMIATPPTSDFPHDAAQTAIANCTASMVFPDFPGATNPRGDLDDKNVVLARSRPRKVCP